MMFNHYSIQKFEQLFPNQSPCLETGTRQSLRSSGIRYGPQPTRHKRCSLGCWNAANPKAVRLLNVVLWLLSFYPLMIWVHSSNTLVFAWRLIFKAFEICCMRNVTLKGSWKSLKTTTMEKHFDHKLLQVLPLDQVKLQDLHRSCQPQLPAKLICRYRLSCRRNCWSSWKSLLRHRQPNNRSIGVWGNRMLM